MERHFTVSGFVSRDGRTALHWHRLGLWLPAGGHIEANEDPIEAVLREVREETGLDVEVLPTAHAVPLPAQPRQLPAPVTIGLYDIADNSADATPHQHIDLVYFTRPLAGQPVTLPEGACGWRWVTADELADGAAPLPRPDGVGGAVMAAIPDDVRRLGLAAIAAERAASAAREAGAR